MTLIQSISGIRGTIGGKPGEGLSPVDVVKFTAAFGSWVKGRTKIENPKMIIGRDARPSGEMLTKLVSGVLQGLGFDVIDLGLSTTPTVEIAVTGEKANGGIILTASHNPKQWNALKLLNSKGEFINEKDGAKVLRIAEKADFDFAEVSNLGSYEKNDTYLEKHIELILDLPLVDTDAIREANLTVALDCVNSTGGIFLPPLLRQLGVSKIVQLYCEPNGDFPHNPEPLPENLSDLATAVLKNKAHLGIAVDPDVDRLALVCEDGEMFGEEYTLVAVADYVLQHNKGNTVSNLSSTRALRDITVKAKKKYTASPVGEVHVVNAMKETDAVIGGEGNGGIIYPELHYGRDALVGVALFLTHLAKSGMNCSVLRSTYPHYHISKNRIELTPEINVDELLELIAEKYSEEEVNTVDGVKIDFEKEWVHLRKSNTEPIIRIYAESESETTANNLANKIIADIKEIIK